MTLENKIAHVPKIEVHMAAYLVFISLGFRLNTPKFKIKTITTIAINTVQTIIKIFVFFIY